MKTLTATAVSDILQDANGRSYKRITLQQEAFTISPEGKKVFNPEARSISYNAYEQRYLDDKRDPLFAMEINDAVAGDIVTRVVDAYEIPERGRDGKPTGNKLSINKDTFLVFGDTTNTDVWETRVTSALNARVKQREKQASRAISGNLAAAAM